jgi:hypothetical protein
MRWCIDTELCSYNTVKECIYIADIKKLSYNKVPVPEGAEEDN